MKKYFFLVILAITTILGVSFLTSCEKDSNLEMVTNPISPAENESIDDSDIKLYADITSFNDSIKACKACERASGTSAPRRSFWNWVQKICKIVVDDINGAAIGGEACGYLGAEAATIGAVVGAAASSILSGITAFSAEEVVPRNSYLYPSGNDSISYLQTQIENGILTTRTDSCFHWSLNNTIVLEFPEDFEETAILVGKSHNFILDLANNDFEYDETFLANSRNFSSLEYNALRSPEFVALINDIIDGHGDWVPETRNRRTSYIIGLFNDVVEEYATSEENISYLINNYIRIIENNNVLDNSEKQIIYNSLAVAAYSYDYWSNFYHN